MNAGGAGDQFLLCVVMMSQLLASLAGRFTLKFEAMRIGQKTNRQRVSHSGIVQIIMPGTDRQLAGDDGRVRTVAILDYFQQVVSLILRQRFQTKIIKDEQVEPCQLSQEFAVTAVAAGDAQFIE